MPAEETKEDDHLLLSLHLIGSIKDTTPDVRFFKGRWSAIAAKLDTLKALLEDFSGLPNLTSNPLSAEFLPSLSNTLSTGLSLSRQCLAEELPAGKLQTQSEIAAIASALERHAADAEILHKTGILLEPAPTADGDPPLQEGSWRETVRVEARNMITRLQIGSAAAKNAALEELTGLLQEDEKNVLIAAAQGVVPALARLLDSPSHETREKAVAALSRVSSLESARHVLLAEGIPLLNHLSRLLESGSSFAKEKSCVALQTLTLDKDRARAFVCRGGISSLLGICHVGTPAAQSAAVGVMKNLAAVEETRAAFAEENAIPVLLAISLSSAETAQENAVACLRNLAAGDNQDWKIAIFREGGVECLKSYWDGEGRNLEPAAGLLCNLASCGYIAEYLVAGGFLRRLAAALGSNSASTRREVMRGIHVLVHGSKEASKEIGETGCIPALVKSLEAKSPEEREAAGKALTALMTVPENRRSFRKEESGIANVVQLLDPALPNVSKRVPVELLTAVGSSGKCRKRMVEAGACEFLQALAEMEVDGAKKLLDALVKRKILGVIRHN